MQPGKASSLCQAQPAIKPCQQVLRALQRSWLLLPAASIVFIKIFLALCFFNTSNPATVVPFLDATIAINLSGDKFFSINNLPVPKAVWQASLNTVSLGNPFFTPAFTNASMKY